jgi:hypothetical protein
MFHSETASSHCFSISARISLHHEGPSCAASGQRREAADVEGTHPYKQREDHAKWICVRIHGKEESKLWGSKK